MSNLWVCVMGALHVESERPRALEPRVDHSRYQEVCRYCLVLQVLSQVS